MKNRLIASLVLVFIITLTGIAQDKNEYILFQEKAYHFPYDLMNPDRIVDLPSKLREVSGIAFIGEGQMAAVQDEKGNIYLLDPRNGEISIKIDFASDGDYEGIALVDNDAWVLKSNGDLYRVRNFLDNEERKVKKFETDLSKKNDLEGIVFDMMNNRLLIAAKGHPYIDNSGGKHKKAIYQFDLKEKKLKPKPVFILDLEEIKYFRKYNTMTRLGIDLMASLDESKGDVTFQPSDVAVHPITGNIYILGAVGDLLIVLNPIGEMLALVELDDILFNQPEGICFSPDGEMYISNEAGDRKATLLRYNPK